MTEGFSTEIINEREGHEDHRYLILIHIDGTDLQLQVREYEERGVINLTKNEAKCLVKDVQRWIDGEI